MAKKMIRVREWERAQFVAEQFARFQANPEIRRVLNILDERKPRDRDYNNTLLSALTLRSTNDLSLEELDLRECFDLFLNALEQFERYIVVGFCSADDLKPYLLPWIQIIGNKDFTRKGLRFYRQLVNYIDYFDYVGVQNLFNRFKYPIPPYGGFQFNVDHLKPNMAEGYNPDHAVALAQASALAYEAPAYIGIVVREEWGFSGYKFLEGKTFGKNRVNTQAYIAWRDDVIILAFRGTKEISDWLTNMERALGKPTDLEQDVDTVTDMSQDLEPMKVSKGLNQSFSGRVHQGFQAAWLSVAGDVLKELDRLRKQRPRCLYITGHSLGGALAAMATAHLLAKGRTVTALYNFGQPRIGDCDFADWFNARFKKSYFRYVNRNDIVPRVPLTIVPRYMGWRPFYHHAGNLMYLDTKGNLQEYVSLWEWLSAQVIALTEKGISWVGDHDMSRYTRFVRRTAQQFNRLQEVSLHAGDTFSIEDAGSQSEPTP